MIKWIFEVLVFFYISTFVYSWIYSQLYHIYIYIYIYNEEIYISVKYHHHMMLKARIPLTLSHHPFQLFIVLDRSNSWYLLPTQSKCFHSQSCSSSSVSLKDGRQVAVQSVFCVVLLSAFVKNSTKFSWVNSIWFFLQVVR